jgi:hypothetical protein
MSFLIYGKVGPDAGDDRDDFLYGRSGPWPQPSPDHPMGEAPEVLHLPEQEEKEFFRHIGLRYEWNRLTYWPKSLAIAVSSQGQPFPSDADFDRMLLGSLMTRFLDPLSDADKIAFAPLLADAGPNVTFWKYDFSAMACIKPIPGTYVSPTVSLIRQEGSEASRTFVAIRCRDVLLTPKNRNAWDLAKAFVLQGASYHILFVVHPALHFPPDTINAITKSSLPKSHPLLQTLLPHCQYSLVLNNAVLEGSASVVNNHAQPTGYDPLTANANQGLKDLFAAGYEGVPPYQAYPKFEWKIFPDSFPSDYGRFQVAYYHPMRRFTDYVARTILTNDPKDEYIGRWARYVGQWLNGFPTEKEIYDADVLGGAMARFMWDVTVGHGADHLNFVDDIPIVYKYLRIRVPPPTSQHMDAVDPRAIYTCDDTRRAAMCQKMFFAPTTVAKLADVDYDYGSETLRRAAQTFFADLRETQATLPGRNFMKLEELPSSIQY